MPLFHKEALSEFAIVCGGVQLFSSYIRIVGFPCSWYSNFVDFSSLWGVNRKGIGVEEICGFTPLFVFLDSRSSDMRVGKHDDARMGGRIL